MNEKVRAITFGKKHSALITEKYDLYTFGGGRYGTLGHGNTQEYRIPKLV